MKTQIHPSTQMGSIHLYVRNLPRSIQFYTQIVGLHVYHRDEHRVTLGVKQSPSPKEVLVVLEEQPTFEVRQHKTTGLYHFALLVPKRKDLAKVLYHLVQSGVMLQGASDHFISEAIYFADPDNHGIEIAADRPREVWEGKLSDILRLNGPLQVNQLLEEIDETPWEGLPVGTSIGHIHLHVGDIETARSFYCHLLGFDEAMMMGNSALFVSAGGYHHHIGLNTWNGYGTNPPDHRTISMKYFTILLPNHQAFEEIQERLKAHHISYIEKDDSIFITDPFENRIRLKVKKASS
jgi:catechol 2,3-dioxygenase